MSKLFGLVERALWVLLYGLDRWSRGVEDFRRLQAPRQPPVRSIEPLPVPPSQSIEIEPPLPATADRSAPDSDIATSDHESPRQEKNVMTVDQDLSGDMVKVVQYTIVSVATNILDTARVLYPPEIVAFGDDMTASDFTSWILSEAAPKVRRHARIYRHQIRRGLQPSLSDAKKIEDKDLDRLEPDDPLTNVKWHRVAFHVISRFAPVDIDWTQAQAMYLGQLANQLKPPVEVDVRLADQQRKVEIDKKSHAVKVGPLLTKPDKSNDT